jgi:hypothetical protein
VSYSTAHVVSFLISFLLIYIEKLFLFVHFISYLLSFCIYLSCSLPPLPSLLPSLPHSNSLPLSTITTLLFSFLSASTISVRSLSLPSSYSLSISISLSPSLTLYLTSLLFPSLPFSVPVAFQSDPWWVPNRGHNDVLRGNEKEFFKYVCIS